ncbi:MAG: VOC family protein [bacterium]|nr:VOC family protein [bacterium]
MDKRILGLHHVTAISDNAKRNFDFYTHVPGLRMVKRPSTSTIPMACSYSIAASPAQPDLLTPFVNRPENAVSPSSFPPGRRCSAGNPVDR